MSAKSVSIATTDLSHLSAHVVGGGVAGLSSAIALAQQGAKVRLSERADAFGEVGAGLQLSPNAMRALTALGVVPDVTGFSQLTLYDGLNDFKLGSVGIAQPDMPYCAVHRADLIDALERRARDLKITIELGAEAQGDPSADLVIGADGVRSKIREQITVSQPRFSGKMAWRALVRANDVDPSWVSGGLQTFLGPSAHLVTYPLRDNSIINVVAIVDALDGVEENWRQQGDVALMRVGFTDWSKRVWQLLDPIQDMMMWGLFDHQPLPRWQDGRQVLMGDAAHPVVPFFAQGAALALEDAVVLANCLTRQDVPEALARFESLRKPRAAAVLQAAWGNARLFHFKNPVMRFGRMATMPTLTRVTPGLFKKRFDWVYSYDPRAEF
ncbi:MAG: FAD-dependent monooxygenase [Pseudomonadota bacterium]